MGGMGGVGGCRWVRVGLRVRTRASKMQKDIVPMK